MALNFIRVLSSPSVAIQCSNEVTKSVKVNTRILSKVELACLFNLGEQLNLLDYYKPKETINDFSQTSAWGNSTREVCILHERLIQVESAPESALTSLLACLLHMKVLGRRGTYNRRKWTRNAQIAKRRQTSPIRLDQ
jgi:hypothetical protein